MHCLGEAYQIAPKGLGAVEGHQQAIIERAMGGQLATHDQVSDEDHEHRCQLLRRDGIERVADLLPARDLVDAEPGAGVVAVPLLLQAHLKIQNRRTRHEEH